MALLALSVVLRAENDTILKRFVAKLDWVKDMLEGCRRAFIH